MKKYHEILAILAQSAVPMGMEKLPLNHVLNRVLLEDIISDMDMPPFDKAAMDGFACRKEDIANMLTVVENIPAGHVPQKTIESNQCARIMTGAIVPSGADMIFMLEDAELIGNSQVICKNLNSKANICYKGEDFRKGEKLLSKGIKIKPAHIGIMASAGYKEVWVSELPHVAIMATGSELVEPNEVPDIAQIRNSNSYTLIALLQDMNIPFEYMGICKDSIDIIRTKTEQALLHNDILLITGGASKGDYDFTSDVLKFFGFEILVETTGLQPGNPMIFAKKGKKYCFGLSGNPVSSFVQFELFVKPFIYQLLSCKELLEWKEVILLRDYKRKKAGRLGIVPVRFHDNYSVEPLPFHGSAHLNALIEAHALMQIPESVTQLNQGEKVYVRPL